MLSRIFGKKAHETITTGEAIQKLQETEGMLIKKQDFLEKKIQDEITTARANGLKNKRVALLALKRKKRYQKSLQQIDGILSTIEMQREALDGAKTNNAVFNTMSDAAKALKVAHQHISLDVDKVHDIMDEIAEQQDLAKEISDAISNPVAFGQDIDEDELEKELENLQQEELNQELLKVGPVAKEELPSESELSTEPLTTQKPKSKPQGTDDDNEDLKNLQLWAS